MKKFSTVFSLLFCLLLSSRGSATSLLPISLQQLSTQASLIFYGEVVDNQVKQDKQSGYIATFTEFNIIELIKGNVADRHTIKQIGGYHNNTGTRLQVHGVPAFQTGKKYVVFLPEKSSLGFSSPLGLHQGSFSVLTIDDEELVSNGRRLSGHYPADTSKQPGSNVQVPLAVNLSRPSQARLSDFINTVRAYNTQ